MRRLHITAGWKWKFGAEKWKKRQMSTNRGLFRLSLSEEVNYIIYNIYQKNEKRDGHWPVFSKDFLERWLNCILKVKYTLLAMKSWAVLCVCVCKCMYALVRLLVFWLQSRHKENLVQRCIHRSTLVCVCVCVWNAI